MSMAIFFKIGTTDASNMVSALSVNSKSQYTSNTNAAGNTVIDYINTKRTIEVEIRPLNSTQMRTLIGLIDDFSVNISYRDPYTNALVSNVQCICAEYKPEYYTIQDNKVMYKKMKLKFQEL